RGEPRSARPRDSLSASLRFDARGKSGPQRRRRTQHIGRPEGQRIDSGAQRAQFEATLGARRDMRLDGNLFTPRKYTERVDMDQLGLVALFLAWLAHGCFAPRAST